MSNMGCGSSKTVEPVLPMQTAGGGGGGGNGGGGGGAGGAAKPPPAQQATHGGEFMKVIIVSFLGAVHSRQQHHMFRGIKPLICLASL